MVLVLAAPPPARAQAPAGLEFQVNTYTTGRQSMPAVAVDDNGDFVVAWQSEGQDGSGGGIFGQRFSAAGAPRGAEFPVNTYTTGTQRFLDVAADRNGDFVVVWGSNGQDGNSYGVFGRRFGADGTPQSPEFRVNTYTTSSQVFPAVTGAPDGGFVVTWNSYNQDGSRNGIFGQVYASDGSRQGAEFQVNTYTPSQQFFPAVASDKDGNFVVVWESYEDGSNSGVFGRLFAAAGTPLGAPFQINTYTTSSQSRPGVAMDALGDFVAVWSSGQDAGSTGIFGRRFDAAGVPQGGEIQVNSFTTAGQMGPSVAADAKGNFVVVWSSMGQDGSDYGIFGRRFDAAGTPLGADFRVNSYTTGRQWFPSVGSDPDGDFVVAWYSVVGQDGSDYGTFGQRFGDLIFQDGFESGGLARWSSVSTGAGNLLVGGPGALAGTSAGMIAFVTDTTPLFVQDDTPEAENRYRARFYFDPNGFDPGVADGHLRVRLMIAFDDLGQRLATIVLKKLGGAYSVEGRVRRDDGSRADTGFFGVTDGPHFIEFDWQRSSAPGASDGLFTLRIDDAVVSTLNNLDNDTRPVESVRMGALSVKTGASGILFFDQFESRRQRYMGPE